LIARAKLEASRNNVKFGWDEAKHAWTLRERGIGFDRISEIFGQPA